MDFQIPSFKKRKKEKLKIKDEEPKNILLYLKKQNYNLKLLLSFSLLINTFLGYGLVENSKTNGIQTFLVERIGNEYIVAGDIEKLASQQKMIPEEQIISTLFSFIEKTKLLTSDLKLYEKNLEKAKYLMTENAKNKSNLYLMSDDYKEFVKKQYRVEPIFITGVRLRESNNSYQLRWKLRITDSNGQIKLEKMYMGIFTIKFITEMKSPSEVINNPLGIKIIDFVQTEEFEQKN